MTTLPVERERGTFKLDEQTGALVRVEQPRRPEGEPVESPKLYTGLYL
jgi:hypothetical protein